MQQPPRCPLRGDAQPAHAAAELPGGPEPALQPTAAPPTTAAMIDPRFSRLALAGMLLLAFSACRKDRPEQPDATPVTIGSGPGVYITNAGNFQWGNASVSYYDIASGSATEDLYAPANGMGLGDVCQSMVL